MWEPLIAAIKKEPEPDLTASMLDSLAEIVDLAEPGQLSAPQVQAAFQSLQSILTQAEARRSQRSKVNYIIIYSDLSLYMVIYHYISLYMYY